MSIPKPNSQPLKSIQDLKADLDSISGENSQKCLYLSLLDLQLDHIETNILFQKRIVGSNSSIVSDLITELGNSDWIKTGLQYLTYNENDENERCPFCQEKTISLALINNIRKYFDKSYEEDKNKIQMILEEYSRLKLEIPKINIFEHHPKFLIYKNEFKIYYGKLLNIMVSNIKVIENKIKYLSDPVSLETSSDAINSLNLIIQNINIIVKEHNQNIDNKNIFLANIKNDFWRIKRWEYDQTISSYNAELEKYKNKVVAISSTIRSLELEIKNQNNIIRQQQALTINIDEAIERINCGLLDLGITDFKIKKISESRYRVIRNETDNTVFHSLSEGEKMVISFIYFVELCKGKRKKGEVNKRKIIVIDDPISSLSHIYVFNIGRLIKNEFFGKINYKMNKNDTEKKPVLNSPYEQVFILTHSLYFFYEITETNHKNRSHTQNLFRLVKNEHGSSFQNMKYESIQNDYQAYWHIIKDDSHHPALIANCMRNIIEYFFNFVEKKDLNNFFQQDPLKNNKYSAFNRYINRESHSLGQNIFDYKEFDYNNFKNAFEELFRLAGYEAHHKKMMGIN